jgi:hypothetical protein
MSTRTHKPQLYIAHIVEWTNGESCLALICDGIDRATGQRVTQIIGRFRTRAEARKAYRKHKGTL